MTEQKRDIHQQITDSIANAVEQGAGEFQMPWHKAAAGGRPKNAVTGTPYTGINTVELWVEQQERGYRFPIWATFKQWQIKGGTVRKGEKATFGVYYSTFDKETTNDAGEAKMSKIPFAKSFALFNIEQVDGVALPDEGRVISELEAVEAAERLVASTGADIRHGGNDAFYHTAQDYVQLPTKEAFVPTAKSSAQENYYSTMLHELTHWTGRKDRLDRISFKKFGDEQYAFEELVAELGAAFLCADLGVSIEPRPDHACYIKNWLQALKDDKKMIFAAASQAEKAAAFLKAFSAKDEAIAA